MIPVQGVRGARVGVLGLGRSGRATAAALAAGGATPVVWDDSAPAREAAEQQGLTLGDLTKDKVLEGLSLLVTSPGIPHLYPAPHPAIAAAQARGIPVDNDIGLFFRSFATEDWDRFDQRPRVVAVT
jgi:UDP-N-acetylmuramoylalanine--D-glutamate ligase